MRRVEGLVAVQGSLQQPVRLESPPRHLVADVDDLATLNPRDLVRSVGNRGSMVRIAETYVSPESKPRTQQNELYP